MFSDGYPESLEVNVAGAVGVRPTWHADSRNTFVGLSGRAVTAISVQPPLALSNVTVRSGTRRTAVTRCANHTMSALPSVHEAPRNASSAGDVSARACADLDGWGRFGHRREIFVKKHATVRQPCQARLVIARSDRDPVTGVPRPRQADEAAPTRRSAS